MLATVRKCAMLIPTTIYAAPSQIPTQHPDWTTLSLPARRNADAYNSE
jgi:hypothetical protein